VSLTGRDLEEAIAELEARLSEQPSFYRGASAVANVGESAPSHADVTRLRNVLADAGITLRALRGVGAEVERVAAELGLAFQPRPADDARLSDGARQLVADFAGARSDIAQRRRRGEGSVRRAKFDGEQRPAPELRLVDAAPSTLYQTATLRGGQVLHHTGNIVVVGDVNPGAELIATGDVLVFGRLAGIAHAGAQGDENARIYALDLTATQLRIATFIAAEERARRRSAPVAEAALVRNGRIAIVSLDRLAKLEAPGAAGA
jgi:septum site-determining protein MinC